MKIFRRVGRLRRVSTLAVLAVCLVCFVCFVCLDGPNSYFWRLWFSDAASAVKLEARVEKFKLAGEKVVLVVDYGVPLQKVLSEGKYTASCFRCRNGERFLVENFPPVNGKGVWETEFVLFHFPDLISTVGAEAKMEEKGCKSADLQQFAVYGNWMAEAQCSRDAIIPLGVLWTLDSRKWRYMALLTGHQVGIHLDEGIAADEPGEVLWSGRTFLGVKVLRDLTPTQQLAQASASAPQNAH